MMRAVSLVRSFNIFVHDSYHTYALCNVKEVAELSLNTPKKISSSKTAKR